MKLMPIKTSGWYRDQRFDQGRSRDPAWVQFPPESQEEGWEAETRGDMVCKLSCVDCIDQKVKGWGVEHEPGVEPSGSVWPAAEVEPRETFGTRKVLELSPIHLGKAGLERSATMCKDPDSKNKCCSLVTTHAVVDIYNRLRFKAARSDGKRPVFELCSPAWTLFSAPGRLAQCAGVASGRARRAISLADEGMANRNEHRVIPEVRPFTRSIVTAPR
jgi:hypothetical protein